MSNVFNVCYFLKKGNADWVKVYWRNRNGSFITANSKAEAVDIAMNIIKTKVKDAGGSIVGRQVTNFQTVDADGTTRTYSNFMAIKMYVDGPADYDDVDDDVDDDSVDDDTDNADDTDDAADSTPSNSGYDINIHITNNNGHPDISMVSRADGSNN